MRQDQAGICNRIRANLIADVHISICWEIKSRSQNETVGECTLKVLNDLVTQAGNSNQVTIGQGSGASGPAIYFGSSSDAFIHRTAADTLALGAGDKLQQSSPAVAGDDVTNVLSVMFLG